MVVPMHRDDYKDKSINELIKVRDEIIEKLKYYEKKYILEEIELTKEEIEVFVCPSPDVIYSVDNLNLIMITKLIREKQNGMEDIFED